MPLTGTFPTARQMSLIAAVAELGGVSAAAAAMGISQPAVTAQLKAAEDALGRRLFVRKRAGLVATAAGRAVATFARRQEAQRLGLVAALADIADGGGALVIGASGAQAQHLLPPLLAALRRTHPKADMRALVGTGSETLARLRNRSVDVALLDVWARARGVRCVQVGVEKIVPVASSASRVVRGHASPRSLSDATFIVREEGTADRRSAIAALRRAGISPARFMPVPTDDAMLSMAAADLGIALAAISAAQRHLDEGRLAHVRIRGWKCRRKIYVARRTDIENQIANEFWELATQPSR